MLCDFWFCLVCFDGYVDCVQDGLDDGLDGCVIFGSKIIVGVVGVFVLFFFVFVLVLEVYMLLYILEDLIFDIYFMVFVVLSVDVIGQVKVEVGVSIWFGVVLCGDIEQFWVGECSNV